MKKVIFIAIFFISIVGCKDKINFNVQVSPLSDSLSLYLDQAKDTTLLRSERINCIQKASAFVLKQKQDTLFLHNLFLVASVYYKIGEIEAYKTTVQLIAERAILMNDNAAIAKSEEYQGDYYRYKRYNDSAYVCYSNAKRMYTVLNDKESIGRIYLNRAFLYSKEGDFLHSQIAAYKALAYSKKDNNQEILYRIYNHLGVLFYELKQYDKAIQFYNKALETVQDTTTYSGKLFKINTLNNLGAAYRDLGENKEAITYYKEALKQVDFNKKIPYTQAMLLDNLAYSQLQLKEYAELPQLFYKALAIRDSLQVIPGIVINKIRLSEYYQDQKDPSKAIQYARQAYTTAKEKGGDPRDILLSLKQLERADPSNAAAYLSEYIEISDNLKTVGPLVIDKLVQAEYENEELLFQKAQLEKDRKNIMIWSISLFSILAFLINQFRIKKKEIQLKFQQAQQKANEEIYELLSEQQIKIQSGKLEEKKRIAQELHDGIVNKLVSIRYGLHPLKCNPVAEETIKKSIPIINNIRNVEKEIIAIAHDLDSFNFSEKNNFTASLQYLLEQQKILSKTKNILIVDPDIEWDTINNSVKMNLYRILQESFQNIYKYAKAENSTVSISKIDNNLTIKIMDDGIGFNTGKKRKGIGLKNIKSRVEKLRGVFDIISEPQKGTTLYITIPLE